MHLNLRIFGIGEPCQRKSPARLCRCAPCICLTFMCRLPSQCVLNQRILRFVIIVVIAVSFLHLYLFLSAMLFTCATLDSDMFAVAGRAFFARCVLCAAKKIRRLLLSPIQQLKRMLFPTVVCMIETIQFKWIQSFFFSSNLFFSEWISQEIGDCSENGALHQNAPCIQHNA